MFKPLKNTSLICVPFLICGSMGDLKKPNDWSHASDPMLWIFSDMVDMDYDLSPPNLIAHSNQSSLTLNYNSFIVSEAPFHWTAKVMTYDHSHLTCNGVSSDLPCWNISVCERSNFNHLDIVIFQKSFLDINSVCILYIF